MKSILRSSLIALAASILATSAFAAAEIGKPAPEFSLTDTEGKAHKLSDFKGKVVVLEWVNLGCPYVKNQYQTRNMQKLQKSYTDKGVVWLTVCSSAQGEQGHHDAAAWNAKRKEHGIASTAVLIDEPGTVGKLYGAKVTPHMFVINADGTLAYNGAIDSAATTNPAETAKAKNHVAAAVDALMAGKAVEVAATKPYGCGIKYR